MIKIQPCLRNAAEVRHACGWLFFSELLFNSGCTVKQLFPLGNQYLQSKQQWDMGWMPSKHAAGPALLNARTSNCEKCYSSFFWGRSSFSLPAMNTILFLLCSVCFPRPSCKEGGSHWNMESYIIYYPMSHRAHLFWSEFRVWCTELATRPKGKQFLSESNHN